MYMRPKISESTLKCRNFYPIAIKLDTHVKKYDFLILKKLLTFP